MRDDVVMRSMSKEQENLKKASSSIDSFVQQSREQLRGYERAEKTLMSIDVERTKLRQKVGVAT